MAQVADIKTPRRRQLSDRAAFFLQSSVIVLFLAGSSAPTPLYSTYQSEWGFSPITTTMIFGIYAVAVLAALLVAGSLSDHVGRKPVLFGAIAAQIVTMVVFINAHDVATLIVGRVIQGLSTGAVVGAVGAGLLDINKAKGTLFNSVLPPLGTGTGALASGLLVQFLPAPTRLIYSVLLVAFVAQLVGVLFVRETSAQLPGALASLKLEVSIPKHLRRPVLLVAPTLIAVWSFAGLYGALGPSLVHMITGSKSHLLGGLALGIAAVVGAMSVYATRKMSAQGVSILGTAALIAGVGVSLIGTSASSLALFYLGTALAGVGFGAAFQGAIRSVVPLAQPHERSGVLSIIYVISYLAMGVPAVIAGVFVVHGGGLLLTARYYGVIEIALSAAALIGVLAQRRSAKAFERESVAARVAS